MRVRDVLLSLSGIALFFLVWFLIDYFNLVHPLFIASPEVVLVEIFRMFSTGEIIDDVLVTLYRALAGYTIAAAIGIPVGLILGYSIIAKKIFTIPVEMGRATPAAAIFPFFLLIGGVSDVSRIMMVIFGCSFITILYSLYGVQNASRTRALYVKSLGATNLQIFKGVTFRDALPYCMVGLRLSLNISLILVVFSEMLLGTEVGLGFIIYQSQYGFHITEMLAIILLTGAIGYFLNLIFIQFERRIVHWAGKT